MATTDTDTARHYTTNEFGKIAWEGRQSEDTYHAGWYDPFESTLRALNSHASLNPALNNLVDAAARVHCVLDVAQSIAISYFGADWPQHVFQIVEMLRHERHEPH